jgi:Multiubiquitin
MNPDSESFALGGKQLPNLPTRNFGPENSVDSTSTAGEIEVKETIFIDDTFVNGKLVEEAVFAQVEVDVEGRRHRWHKETITAMEIARLGGWSSSEGVLHIDSENNERTLRHDEEVRVEIGISFAKKVRFKRG